MGRVLFAAADTFMWNKLQLVRERSAEALPTVQLALFHNLDVKGTRLTDLAARARITKQSMSELVDKAETLEFVKRHQDPGDLRAKVVTFTARGLRMHKVLQEGTAEAERLLADAVGPAFFAHMKVALGAYALAHDRPTLTLTKQPGSDDQAAAPTFDVGHTLANAADTFVRDILSIARRHGGGAAVHVQMALFRNLDLHGTRLTEIAARASMTKQAMLELVDKAQAAGLVERRPDACDRRAKVVFFTTGGLAMLDALREGVSGAERRMATVLGRRLLLEMKDRLTVYAEGSGVFRLDGPIPADGGRRILAARPAIGDEPLMRGA